MSNVERECTLKEWCDRLHPNHRVNKERRIVLRVIALLNRDALDLLGTEWGQNGDRTRNSCGEEVSGEYYWAVVELAKKFERQFVEIEI